MRAPPRFVGIGRCLALVVMVGGCRSSPQGGAPSDAVAPTGAGGGQAPGRDVATIPSTPPLGPPVERVQPRVGMVYVPPGALVVGTAPERRPRRADREIAGEQVMLDGFYIDILAYPNEEGAIPITNVNHEEAEGLCRARGQRLCTELEWERACKGPDNRTYEYGEHYQENVCHTGRPAGLRPAGYYSACQSDFGVRDLHGGPFEWTRSAYARGSTSSEVVLKGGNGRPGEVIGRCANLEKARPSERSGTVGFRCCLGGDPEVKLELDYKFGPGLIPRVKFEDSLEALLLAALPADARSTLARVGKLRRERVWLWRPIANEEIHLMALCARAPAPFPRPACGLFAAQVSPAGVVPLAWASSGEWVANLHHPGPFTHLLLLGGDQRGSFKRPITYRYGDLALGDVAFGWKK